MERPVGVKARPPSARRSTGGSTDSAVSSRQPSARDAPARPARPKSTDSGLGGLKGASAEYLPPRPTSSGRNRNQMTVGVRVRPLSELERSHGAFDTLKVEDGCKVFARDPDDKMGGIDYLRLDKNKDKAYQFDRAFGPDSTSAEVYEHTVRRVVRAVLDGFHGSIFACAAQLLRRAINSVPPAHTRPRTGTARRGRGRRSR